VNFLGVQKPVFVVFVVLGGLYFWVLDPLYFGGHNFLISNPFSMIVNASDASREEVQICLDTINNRALPLGSTLPWAPKCLIIGQSTLWHSNLMWFWKTKLRTWFLVLFMRISILFPKLELEVLHKSKAPSNTENFHKTKTFSAILHRILVMLFVHSHGWNSSSVEQVNLLPCYTHGYISGQIEDICQNPYIAYSNFHILQRGYDELFKLWWLIIEIIYIYIFIRSIILENTFIKCSLNPFRLNYCFLL